LAQEQNEIELGGRPFARQLADDSSLPKQATETAFEKARGVNQVEIRTGFASARIGGLHGDVVKERLAILQPVFEAGISFDFLKFAADGMSFVVPESLREELERVLHFSGAEFEVKGDRAVLIIHAVNMRDEAGLVSKIVSQVIDSGANIEHLGEMHDRLLMLMGKGGADKAKAMILAANPEAES
jgi:aspartokinase